MEEQSTKNVQRDVQELVCESGWFSCLDNLQFENAQNDEFWIDSCVRDTIFKARKPALDSNKVRF